MKNLYILLLLLIGSAQASDLSEQLLTCKQQADSLKRLVCYDDVVASIDAHFSNSSVTIEPVVKQEMPKKPEKPQLEKAQKIFGHEIKQRTTMVNQVNFTIKSVKLSLRKKWRFIFNNGQQWEQKDSDKFAKFEAGDAVIIKRGLMNAFYLKKLDSNRTIRVKRIK